MGQQKPHRGSVSCGVAGEDFGALVLGQRYRDHGYHFPPDLDADLGTVQRIAI